MLELACRFQNANMNRTWTWTDDSGLRIVSNEKAHLLGRHTARASTVRIATRRNS